MIQIPTFSLRRRLVDEMYRTVYRAIIRDDKLLRFTFTSNKNFSAPLKKDNISFLMITEVTNVFKMLSISSAL